MKKYMLIVLAGTLVYIMVMFFGFEGVGLEFHLTDKVVSGFSTMVSLVSFAGWSFLVFSIGRDER